MKGQQELKACASSAVQFPGTSTEAIYAAIAESEYDCDTFLDYVNICVKNETCLKQSHQQNPPATSSNRFSSRSEEPQSLHMEIELPSTTTHDCTSSTSSISSPVCSLLICNASSAAAAVPCSSQITLNQELKEENAITQEQPPFLQMDSQEQQQSFSLVDRFLKLRNQNTRGTTAQPTKRNQLLQDAPQSSKQQYFGSTDERETHHQHHNIPSHSTDEQCQSWNDMMHEQHQWIPSLDISHSKQVKPPLHPRSSSVRPGTTVPALSSRRTSSISNNNNFNHSGNEMILDSNGSNNINQNGSGMQQKQLKTSEKECSPLIRPLSYSRDRARSCDRRTRVVSVTQYNMNSKGAATLIPVESTVILSSDTQESRVNPRKNQNNISNTSINGVLKRCPSNSIDEQQKQQQQYLVNASNAHNISSNTIRGVHAAANPSTTSTNALNSCSNTSSNTSITCTANSAIDPLMQQIINIKNHKNSLCAQTFYGRGHSQQNQQQLQQQPQYNQNQQQQQQQHQQYSDRKIYNNSKVKKQYLQSQQDKHLNGKSSEYYYIENDFSKEQESKQRSLAAATAAHPNDKENKENNWFAAGTTTTTTANKSKEGKQISTTAVNGNNSRAEVLIHLSELLYTTCESPAATSAGGTNCSSSVPAGNNKANRKYSSYIRNSTGSHKNNSNHNIFSSQQQQQQYPHLPLPLPLPHKLKSLPSIQREIAAAAATTISANGIPSNGSDSHRLPFGVLAATAAAAAAAATAAVAAQSSSVIANALKNPGLISKIQSIQNDQVVYPISYSFARRSSVVHAAGNLANNNNNIIRSSEMHKQSDASNPSSQRQFISNLLAP